MQVMEYEAVHPLSDWNDLKQRLSADRRVFGYFHSSMPEEPLVLLHTALMDTVPSSMKQILHRSHQGDSNAHIRHVILMWGVPAARLGLQDLRMEIVCISLCKATQSVCCASRGWLPEHCGGFLFHIFHTAGPVWHRSWQLPHQTGTSKHLRGRDLQCALKLPSKLFATPMLYIHAQVAHKLQAQIPGLQALVTLSPIPNFRKWLTAQLLRNDRVSLSERKTGTYRCCLCWLRIFACRQCDQK